MSLEQRRITEFVEIYRATYHQSPSISEIAQGCCLKPRQVMRELAALVVMGWHPVTGFLGQRGEVES